MAVRAEARHPTTNTDKTTKFRTASLLAVPITAEFSTAYGGSEGRAIIGKY
jgi:hypothetical protein